MLKKTESFHGERTGHTAFALARVLSLIYKNWFRIEESDGAKPLLRLSEDRRKLNGFNAWSRVGLARLFFRSETYFIALQ